MPLTGYYINAPTFALATSIFTDVTLTTYAANGWYSDGTISRQLFSGILAPAAECESCATPCGESISASGGEGIFNLSINTGDSESSVGAIVVRFNPISVPDGIFAMYDGVLYNALSSPIYGFLQSTDGDATYIGNAAGTTYCSWYPSGGTVTDVFVYSYNGTSFVPTGALQDVTVNAGQIQVAGASPNRCVMVIPKLTPTPAILDLQMIGICADTAWSIAIDCPTLLPSFIGGPRHDSGTAPDNYPCTEAQENTYYFAKVHIADDTYISLYDWIFDDAYGQNTVPDGWYSVQNLPPGLNSILVENGVVVDLIDKCF